MIGRHFEWCLLLTPLALPCVTTTGGQQHGLTRRYVYVFGLRLAFWTVLT